MARLFKSDYTVGWLAALSVELAAAKAILDKEHREPIDYRPHRMSNNHYIFGSISGHNVVLATLPVGAYGTTSATNVANDFKRDFPHLIYRFMVGIGGGAPSVDHDIRLGDVVVSKPVGVCPGIIQYDLGKALGDNEFEQTGSLPKPPQNLLRALPLVQSLPPDKLSEEVYRTWEKAVQEDSRFERPEGGIDMLFLSDYEHAGSSSSSCESHCDREFCALRGPRSGSVTDKDSENPPVVHYGIIASGNTLLRDAETRDKVQKLTGALCFEMEAAGIMEAWECLVIRGICDYCDTHKNKKWQPFAALMAAAFTKVLLSKISSSRALEDDDPMEFEADTESRRFPQYSSGRSRVRERYEFENSRRHIEPTAGENEDYSDLSRSVHQYHESGYNYSPEDVLEHDSEQDSHFLYNHPEYGTTNLSSGLGRYQEPIYGERQPGQRSQYDSSREPPWENPNYGFSDQRRSLARPQLNQRPGSDQPAQTRTPIPPPGFRRQTEPRYYSEPPRAQQRANAGFNPWDQPQNQAPSQNTDVYELATANGDTIRVYGTLNVQMNHIWNGNQEINTEGNMKIGGGRIFNGSQKFSAKGDIEL